jgi:amino acid adenylation domain-containing protein
MSLGESLGNGEEWFGVASLIRQAAEENQDRVAISDGQESLTYGELVHRADSVASELDALGSTGPVGVLLCHGIDLVTGFVAVMFANRPIVPLDVNFPSEVLRRMLDVAGASALLTHEAASGLADDLCGADLMRVELECALGREPADANWDGTDPDGTAYILFTSGTTGEPKGVAHSEASLLRSASHYAEENGLASEDRVSLAVACTFTPFVFSLFGALLSGATLCPYDLRRRGAGEMGSWLEDEQVTVFQTVPTIFRRTFGELSSEQLFPRLRVIHLDGEPLLHTDVAIYRRGFAPNARLCNGMGTTETSMICAGFIEEAEEVEEGLVPVGRPYDDVEVLLLDEGGAEVGANEPGELFVRGRYVAQGYWGRPDLTAASFEIDEEDPDLRIYRTGDLALRRDDGRLVHLGRKDLQIKVRGQRVEPAHVEAVMSALPGHREAAVVGVEELGAGHRLVGFVVPGASGTVDGRNLRRQLSERLPGYMVPGQILSLPRFPQTQNGKLDRLALVRHAESRPPGEGQSERVGQREPKDEVERRICQLYAQVLGLDAVGPEEDFFDLGGESLQALDLVMALEKAFGVVASASSVIQVSSPEGFARMVREGVAADGKAGVIVLQPGFPDSDKPTVFCVSGEGGHVICFRPLVTQLGADVRCIGLEHGALSGQTEMPEDIDAVGATFAAEVMRVAPEGPIALMGYSLGGAFAHNIAKVLLALGREVSHLALLDAYSPKAMRGRTGWERVVAHGRTLRGLPLRDWPGYLGGKIRDRRKGADPADQAQAEVLPSASEERRRRLVASYRRGLEAYRPDSIDLPATLFRALERPSWFESWYDPYEEWHDLVSGVTVVDLPCSHLRLFESPALDVMARSLKPAIREEPEFGSLGGEVTDPSGLFWCEGSSPELDRLDAWDLPETERSLLHHGRDMTTALAQYHRSSIGVRVLSKVEEGLALRRVVVLFRESDEQLVEVASIRIELERLEPAARELILAEELPFGAVLDRFGIYYRGQLQGLLRVGPDTTLQRLLHLRAPMSLFARHNEIVDESGHCLADSFEILAPLKVTAAS